MKTIENYKKTINIMYIEDDTLATDPATLIHTWNLKTSKLK
jgi:hypothetical protein